ncbi:hypothetical protein CEP51_004313 [Fusarium floridanum]|uniref:Oxidoreductase n=1 Tax=Fusarium floridanum TaxID=1325733 RepID=A0A428S1T4_9HYPO|nr:hypothetical protein CEP51_004313 [Fusarium floridanum]
MAAVSAFNVLAIPGLHDAPTIDDLRESSNMYNQLPHAETQLQIPKQHLQHILAMIQRHGVKQSFGIHLIHRHDQIGEDMLRGSGKIADSDPEGWMRNFDVNSKGFYLVLRAFIPLLIESDGKKTIINVSSVGAHCCTPTLSGYQISKLATLRLAEFATAEYGDRGLVVYCIHPGSIATEMVLQQWPQSAELSAAFADKPELAGDSIVYLTSEKRDWLAGRYINLTWDLPELMGKKEWIVANDKLKVKLSV